MRVLVTGGLGFIGSAFIRYVHRSTDAVICNADALTYAAHPAAVAELASSSRYQFHCANVCDAAAMGRLIAQFDPDAIVHFAAETHVDRSIDDAGPFIATNVTGTQILLDAARTHWSRLPQSRRDSFRFLHVSTDEVYGALGRNDLPVTEDHPYRPNSPYAASKAASDHLVRAWHRTYGLPTLLCNACNNYGPWQFPEKLIPLMIRKALAGERLPVYGTGQNIREWLHVDDHVAALWLVLSRACAGARYNIGGGTEITNIALIEQLCRNLDMAAPRGSPYRDLITFVPDRPGHDFRYALDSSRIRSELGWSPQISLGVGLAQTVAWYLERDAGSGGWRDTRYGGERLGLPAGAS